MIYSKSVRILFTTFHTKIFVSIFVILWSIIPTQAQRVHFSNGLNYSMFVCKSKSVYSWGDNFYGQLARNEISCEIQKPCVANFSEKIISIDCGFGGFGLALTENNQVMSWGHNFNGELGSGNACDVECSRENPDFVIGGSTGEPLLTNVVSIATGQNHAYALLESGIVVAWGNNNSGQLGNNTTISSSSPVIVLNAQGTTLQNIVYISAGANHGYAIDNNGNAYAWGNNTYSQLGIGNSTSQKVAQKILLSENTPILNVSKIDGGGDFGLLLLTDNTVWGIGAYKGSSQDENGLIYKIPLFCEAVPGGQTANNKLKAIDISAGYTHATAIIEENNKKYAVAWGNNRFPTLNSSNGGQIGNGIFTVKQYFSPQYMLNENNTRIQGVNFIQAGSGISMLQTFDDATEKDIFLVCGANHFKALGTENNIDKLTPTDISNKVCNPYCEGLYIGNSKELCTPIFDSISANLSEDDYDFSWKKNNIALDSTRSILQYTDIGTYELTITHKSGECENQTAEIIITEKNKKFDYINTSYCTNPLIFKVIGDGIFKWRASQSGAIIGSGNVLTTAKELVQEIEADKTYQVWLEHTNECQSLPLTITKNCSCNTLTPTLIDSSSCYNRPYFIRANGDSIVWYSDAIKTKPLFLGNIYYPTQLNVGNHTLHATQIQNGCESDISSGNLSLQFCEPWYTISGTVLANNTPVNQSKVYAIKTQDYSIVDSTVTNSQGLFTLYSHEHNTTILSNSPLVGYKNTWVGNKIDKEHAYEFIVDANIKEVKIDLIPITTNILDISNSSKFLQLDYVKIYSNSAVLLGIFNPNMQEIISQIPSNIPIIIIGYKNNEIFFVKKIIK